jgi:hypothetical protein
LSERPRSASSYSTRGGTVWSESDVERDGVGIEPLLSQLNQVGGGAEIVVIDASRRNPFERRFREYSHGLAPIDAPDNALVVTSELPDQIAYDSSDRNSVLVSELLKKLSAPAGSTHAVFSDALLDVARNKYRRCRRPWSTTLTLVRQPLIMGTERSCSIRSGARKWHIAPFRCGAMIPHLSEAGRSLASSPHGTFMSSRLGLAQENGFVRR